MARPRRPESYSPAFSGLYQERAALNENNDCAIYCLAIVLGVSYETLARQSYQLGRKRGEGTRWTIIHALAESHGFRLRRMSYIEMRQIIDTEYPERDRVLQNITTHHPVRFAKAWRNKPTMILDCRRHVAAFKDGRVHDWTEGRAMRVWALWLVERI